MRGNTEGKRRRKSGRNKREKKRKTRNERRKRKEKKKRRRRNIRKTSVLFINTMVYIFFSFYSGTGERDRGTARNVRLCEERVVT